MELMDQVSACFVVTTMSICLLVFFLPIALLLKEPLLGVEGERFYVFQRALFGFLAFLTSYLALFYISFSDSSSILFSAPVFVSIFACILLKEECGVFQVACVIFTIIGVFMVSRPSFIFGGTEEDVFTASERIIGVVLSLVACITMSLGN